MWVLTGFDKVGWKLVAQLWESVALRTLLHRDSDSSFFFSMHSGLSYAYPNRLDPNMILPAWPLGEPMQLRPRSSWGSRGLGFRILKFAPLSGRGFISIRGSGTNVSTLRSPCSIHKILYSYKCIIIISNSTLVETCHQWFVSRKVYVVGGEIRMLG